MLFEVHEYMSDKKELVHPDDIRRVKQMGEAVILMFKDGTVLRIKEPYMDVKEKIDGSSDKE